MFGWRRIVGWPCAWLLGPCPVRGAWGPARAALATANSATSKWVSTAAATPIARPPTPVFGAFDPASVNRIKLDEYPVIPTISATARAIYQAGLARGHQARVFSKLGDCMTENPFFLVT